MTEGGMTIPMPRITAALTTPSPATINRAFALVLTVEEVSVTLEPEMKYAGELYSGEV